MKTRCRGVLLILAAAVLIPWVTLQAQTTGRIVGQIVDAQGAVVPGVTVTVSSPNLQGVQTQVTDSQGNFRFPSLPPGRYTVKAELASFKNYEQPNVDVGLDKTVSLAVKLDLAGVAEAVTVAAQSPSIDTTSNTTGVNVTPDLFNRLPVRRDFIDLTRLAPGVVNDAVGPTFYGSSGAENQYIIDGLNTTGVELGDKGKSVNSDFIQEVEVKTGGLPAEYGRMTGGLVNVLTKSGSNQFRGSAFGFGEGGGLQSDNKTADKRPQTTTQVADIAHLGDFGGELGGFIVKDKLWFFGAYDHINQKDETTVIRTISSVGAPGIGSVIPADIDTDLYAAKLTGKIGTGHTVNVSFTGDPSTRDGNVFAISGPPSTFTGTRDSGALDVAGRYNGVFGSTFLLAATIARHKEKDEFGGAGRDTAQIINNTVSPAATSGGFGFFQDQKFSRDVYKADATKYWAGHEIKGGADFEHIKAFNNNFNGGAGQRISILSTGAGGTGTVYYRHRFYVNDRAAGFVRSDPTTWTIAVPLTSEPDSQNVSFYAQDSWKPGAGLTVNAGVRWERQDVRNRDKESAFKLNDNWAPRLGVVWDVAHNGRSKLYANYGRFYESIPMDINIRAFGGELQCFCYNFDINPSNTIPDPTAPVKSSLFGSSIEPVDPNLKGQYIEEFLTGFEYQLQNNVVLGAKFTRRNLGRVIEDFLIPSDLTYFIANPGSGIGSEVTFFDYTSAPAPKARRQETAFELTAQKRFSRNYQLLASAVFSKLEGNYDGTFQNSTGQLDPNINSAFDYADFLVNADGKLSNDRKFQFKLDGSYSFSSGPLNGMDIGVSTHVFSGTPLNAYGYSVGYNNWEYYLAPRGSVGRGPRDYETNLHVAYPIRFSGSQRLTLIADIFNLFDRQAITQLDQRYNIIQDGKCAGIPGGLCNGDGGLLTNPGTLTPAGTINPANATNPDYLIKGTAFTGQRSIRLGARFTF
jgi:Carboxypeptidase regulatory-like domain/TonB dependent receptor-like, beta-barrel